MSVREQLWRALGAAGAGTMSVAGYPDRLTILIYHSVGPSPDPLGYWETTAADFEHNVLVLKRAFNVIRLRDAVRHLAEGTLPPRAADAVAVGQTVGRRRPVVRLRFGGTVWTPTRRHRLPHHERVSRWAIGWHARWRVVVRVWWLGQLGVFVQDAIAHQPHLQSSSRFVAHVAHR